MSCLSSDIHWPPNHRNGFSIENPPTPPPRSHFSLFVLPSKKLIGLLLGSASPLLNLFIVALGDGGDSRTAEGKSNRAREEQRQRHGGTQRNAATAARDQPACRWADADTLALRLLPTGLELNSLCNNVSEPQRMPADKSAHANTRRGRK